MGSGLRAYRNARAAARAGKATKETEKVIDDYESYVRSNDKALQFITGCRTSFMFFDGNTSFRWTFISPSSLYRPGKRTGTYQVTVDVQPLKGDMTSSSELDGRLHGISAADLALAIADEIEKPEKEGKHWSAYADLSDDTPAPSYVTLDNVK